ncbi:MAG TPA: M20/M25/M40 family metallo-hydrolase [Bryobacteraceae bacterium]|nr:M20/M25/M40 family metallo-hydrolase [Bryobacteraceae bacterium]
MQFLADDRLEGRDTGSAGYLEAARYVARQFQMLGLKPCGTKGYFQPVKFETRRLDPRQSSLTLIHDGVREPLVIGQDVNLSSSADMPPSVSAPVVFAGYGLSIPGAAARSVDVRGKIVVYVAANGPPVAPANVQSFYASAGERWSALKQAGAIGIAMIANPRLEAAPAASAPAAPAARTVTPPAVLLAEPALQDTAGQQIALTLSRRGGERFFAGSGHSFDEIMKLAAANQPLPEFPLAVSMEARTSVKKEAMEAPNVVAMLAGSDAKLKREYVVVSAHLDHIGVGAAVNGDRIYNGAMDNASGVASVLEVARLLHASGLPPKRSVIFLVLTAEEKGLLGSKYFAHHPTVPESRIVADLNMDALLPLYDLKLLEVQGLDESTLGDKIRAAAREFGVEAQSDREPEQNRFIRSDHFSFVREGIPALAFKFGYEYGSPEQKIRLDWWDRHYHKPSDDTAHPMNTEAAAKFNHVIEALVQSVADDPARPEWLPDSFFRKFRK